MASEPPEYDIRSKWQSQPNGPAGVSVEEIRQKAQKLQRKARREVLLLYGFALFFAVFFGRAFARSHETLSLIGLGLLIASALYLPYQAQKRLWPRNPAAEAASTTGLEFYRRELERRRDYMQHIWRLLGPLLFSLGVFLLPAVIKAFKNSGLWLNILPVAVLLVFWAALAIPLRKRQLRKLRRELDALDALKS